MKSSWWMTQRTSRSTSWPVGRNARASGSFIAPPGFASPRGTVAQPDRGLGADLAALQHRLQGGLHPLCRDSCRVRLDLFTPRPAADALGGGAHLQRAQALLVDPALGTSQPDR